MKDIDLLYSKTCPKCRTVAAIVAFFDVAGYIELLPLEENEELVESWHGGEYVHAPHIRRGRKLHWGVSQTAWRVMVLLPPLSVLGLITRTWRQMLRTGTALKEKAVSFRS